jgi:tRNA nucleotidyltransferase/poly(A) polymerase
MVELLPLPKLVKVLMHRLLNAGFATYVVGGSIRDHLLGVIVKDYDLATEATPQQIKEVFSDEKLLVYGEKHGTIGVYKSGGVIEITTFREEAEYRDGRRPSSVTFVKNLKADLSRRDFTINALAATVDGEIVDYFDGITDFNRKIIRAVGNPLDRLQEDSLRMLRAIRFASRLGFSIDEDTTQVIKANGHLLQIHDVSGERILNEITEILRNQSGLILLHKTSLLENIFPMLYDTQVVEEMLDTFRWLDTNREQKNKTIVWSVVFHFLSKLQPEPERKKLIKKIMRKYPGLGNNFTSYCIILVRSVNNFSTRFVVYSPASVARWIRELKRDLIKIKNYTVEQLVTNTFELLEVPAFQNKLESQKIAQIEVYTRELLLKKEREFPMSGHHAKEHGFSGKAIADLLTQWQVMYERNPVWDEQDLHKYAQQLTLNFHISSSDVRHSIAEGELLNTAEETNAVIKELLRIIRLVRSRDAFIVIDVGIEEKVSFLHKLQGIDHLVIAEGKSLSSMVVTSETAFPTVPENIRELGSLQIKLIIIVRTPSSSQSQLARDIMSILSK